MTCIDLVQTPKNAHFWAPKWPKSEFCQIFGLKNLAKIPVLPKNLHKQNFCRFSKIDKKFLPKNRLLSFDIAERHFARFSKNRPSRPLSPRVWAKWSFFGPFWSKGVKIPDLCGKWPHFPRRSGIMTPKMGWLAGLESYGSSPVTRYHSFSIFK